MSIDPPATRSPTLKFLPSEVELSGKHGIRAGAGGKDRAQLKQACQAFEAVLLNFMVSKMRETVPASGLLEADGGDQIYRGMLDEELSKRMAASGGIGLGDVLFRQLSGRQAADKK